MKHKISIYIVLVFGVLILVFLPDWTSRWVALGGLGLLWLSMTAAGSFDMRLNWYLTSVKSVEENAIALSFDDGPDPILTPVLLSILREQKVIATFFLIGEKAERYPEIVAAIHNEGHLIGNHSYSHSRRIGFFSTKRLSEDLIRCNKVLESLIDQPVKLFRPPFGVTNPRYARVLSRLNMISVGWSLRSYDTVTRDKEKLITRLNSKVKPGQIVLLHDTVTETLEVLPLFILECRLKNIEFVKISDALKNV